MPLRSYSQGAQVRTAVLQRQLNKIVLPSIQSTQEHKEYKEKKSIEKKDSSEQFFHELELLYLKKCKESFNIPSNRFLECLRHGVNSERFVIRLRHQHIDSSHFNVLCEAIEEAGKGLENLELDLDSNRVGRKGIQALCRLLKSDRISISSLNFSEQTPQDKLNFNSYKSLVAALVSSRKSIRQLYLSDIGACDQKSHDLGRVLVECEFLSICDFSKNSFSDETINSFLNAFDSKNQLCKLAVLNLSWNCFTPFGFTKLFNSIRDNSELWRLQHLDLSFNSIEDGPAGLALIDILKANNLKTLRSLDIAYTKIHKKVGLALAEAIEKNNHLFILRISFNTLGEHASVDIVKSLYLNTTLKTLYIENTCHKHDDESPNEIDYHGDGALQRLWDMKEAINYLRQQNNSTLPRVNVWIEHPYRERTWDGTIPPEFLDDEEEEKQEEDHENLLHIENSCFEPRKRECDSKWYYDSATVFTKSFKVDWKIIQPKLERYFQSLPTSATKGGVLNKVREILKQYYAELMDIFTTYVSADPTTPKSIGLNQFLDILENSRLTEKDISYGEIAFVSANVELRNEDVFMKEVNQYNPDRSLIRPELFEALIRVAVKKYIIDKTDFMALDCAHAVEMLLSDYVVRNFVCSPGNKWRKEVLYRYDVHMVFQRYKDLLDYVWDLYNGRSDTDKTMTIQEWMKLVKDANIESTSFSHLEASQAFLLSNMKTSGDYHDTSDSEDCSTALTKVEFYEALTRVADYHKDGELSIVAETEDGDIQVIKSPTVSQKLCRILLQVFQVGRKLEKKNWVDYWSQMSCISENIDKVKLCLTINCQDIITGPGTKFWTELSEKEKQVPLVAPNTKQESSSNH